MRKKGLALLLGMLVMAGIAVGAFSAHGAFAASPPASFSASVVNVSASGGTSTFHPIGPVPGGVVIRTVGETTTASLDCAGDLVCSNAGLNGASVETTHNSEVRLAPTATPGTFSMAGHLKGSLLIGGAIPGKLEAAIEGTAACYPSPGLCTTFSLSVTDTGKWNTPSLKAKGTLVITVSGLLGVSPLTGSGTLFGTIH